MFLVSGFSLMFLLVQNSTSSIVFCSHELPEVLINKKPDKRPSINNVLSLMEIGVNITCTGHQWFCGDHI